MGWDAVVERFVKQSPLTVMAHVTLRRALAASWLDALLAQHAERQHVRSLLFSTVVDLMAAVTFGFRPSIHAAAKALGNTLPVSLTALYDKINRTELVLVRALVRDGAQRLARVLSALAGVRRAAVDPPRGYRNGPGRPQRLAMLGGTMTVRRPRVRELEERFESRIVPLFVRRTEEVAELLPQLYLHGLDSGGARGLRCGWAQVTPDRRAGRGDGSPAARVALRRLSVAPEWWHLRPSSVGLLANGPPSAGGPPTHKSWKPTPEMERYVKTYIE